MTPPLTESVSEGYAGQPQPCAGVQAKQASTAATDGAAVSMVRQLALQTSTPRDTTELSAAQHVP